MSSRLRRTMLLLGMTILVIQTAFMPIGILSAETTMDTYEHEPVELPSTQNSLEELNNYPNFNFQQSDMQGIVNSPINVTISSDQEVSEVKIRLPEEATVIKDQLSEGTSVVQEEQPYEWIVQSESVRTTFVLTLVFESEGNYELFLEDTKATVDISNKEGITGEELVEESSSNDSSIMPEREPSESSLNNDEKEDIKDHISEEASINEEYPSTRSSVNVSTWAQYAEAINNQSVTMINVTANISGNTSLNVINRDLTINGNGFTINSQAQSYRITGANRQLSVRNAIISGTLTGTNTTFSATTGASNTRFIFSDITFRGNNRFLGPQNVVRDIHQTVIFDGGISSFSGDDNTNGLFANVSDLQVINKASIDVTGRRFRATVALSLIDTINSSMIYIEEGASLRITSPGIAIVDSSMQVDGDLEIYTQSGAAIGNTERRTEPAKVVINKNARVKLERASGSGAIFNFSTAGGELTIAEKAKFEFFNRSGGPVTSSGTNRFFLDITSTQLALWDRGLQNEEKASMVFKDLAIKLDSTNGSEIISVNNERFQRLYDSAGLSSYSRMSNHEVKEMIRFVHVHYENEQGLSIKDDDKLSGLLGDPYQSVAKEIQGYQLTTLPENASGEFTREAVQVIYVYQRVSVSPVDPLNPEIEVDPENKPELPEDQGQLSIDFVSSFDFGSQAISAHDQTYYAQPQRLLNEDGIVNESEERPNYVQISDRRPENERNGWQLAVTQKEQFKGKENQELKGASLSLSNQQVVTAQVGTAPGLQSVPCVLIPGNRRTLLKAQGNEGTGTWIYRFGDADTQGESVALNVPKGANPEATRYSTTLIWELSAVPGN